MPLSDHEQRLLEEIEQALYADDPKFATSYRATDLRTHYRRRLYRCLALLALGIAALVVGIVLSRRALVAGGVVVTVVGALVSYAGWQRMSGRRVPRALRTVAPAAPSGQPRRPAGSFGRRRAARQPGRPPRGGSLVARLEARWERRQEGRGR